MLYGQLDVVQERISIAGGVGGPRLSRQSVSGNKVVSNHALAGSRVGGAYQGGAMQGGAMQGANLGASRVLGGQMA